MEVIRINSLSEVPRIEANITATIGEFDGIHLAHQLLFKKTLELACKNNTKSAVITFDPHPDSLIKKVEIQSIFSLEEKIEQIKTYNFDYLFVINFSKDILEMPHQDFSKHYLKKLNIVHLVIGFDFKYGYRGLGNKDTIIKEGIKNVEVIPEVIINNKTVSSTYIKELLAIGELTEANKLLDKNFTLSGEVIHGRNIGEKISVPTANLKLSHNYPILKEGVYVVKCIIKGKKYLGIANIGHNPSFNYYQDLSYEIHIIEENFNENLYHQNIQVEFIKYLRNEIVFNTIDDFKKQIEKDKKEAFFTLNNGL